MKYKKITIETDGTTKNTKIFIDGKQIGFVQRIELLAEANENYVFINVAVGKVVNNQLKTKRVKVRNIRTERIEEKDEVQTETLILERN